MTPSDFIHLHVHTEYSLLDGAIRISDLLSKCKVFGMDSVAITDHGVMYGALEFYLKAREKGIKPIVGCEFYIAPGHRTEKNPDAPTKAFHLVLLAMNYTGYKNMMKLASIAQIEGFLSVPRIDKEILTEFNQGVICLSGCLNGELPWLIAHKKTGLARKKAEEFKKIFGDRFYLELQDNNIPAQKRVNEELKNIAAELDIKLVATNDCHYLNREDAHSHEVLLCIQTGRTVFDPDRFRFSYDSFYFKSSDEMRSSFLDCPEALSNTLEIANRCDLEIPLDEYYFPKFPVPDGKTQEAYFVKKCSNGLERRLKEIEKLSEQQGERYRDRLDHEMKVIVSIGLDGAFLIFSDAISWAKKNSIQVGPGRGTIVGSLVAYALKATEIDPVSHNLIFEHFLNLGQTTAPTFAIDICPSRRNELISYLGKRHAGYFAQLLSWRRLSSRDTIRDVGRALGCVPDVVDIMAELFPEENRHISANTVEIESRLHDIAEKNPSIKELLRLAKSLKGLPRYRAIHVAGVVVSPKSLPEYMPLCIGRDGEMMTQYDMVHVAKAGLIKFDFLGLKTLTVIENTLKLIKDSSSKDLDINAIPIDDCQTIELFRTGKTTGIFQFESPGMRELMEVVAPERFSDLSALVALFRPSPLDSGMVEKFVNSKQGQITLNCSLSETNQILEETYGVILYQEQVMRIANIIAGYPLGEVYQFYRLLAKRIPCEIERERKRFIEGAIKNQIDKKKAEHLYNQMVNSTCYSCPKSHSVAYSLISYQAAYLKTHHPLQFMASLLTAWEDSDDKIKNYLKECLRMGIDLLPTDINASPIVFSIENNKIRFGLSVADTIKKCDAEAIINERKKNGRFISLSDFTDRLTPMLVSKRGVDALHEAGAFNTITKRGNKA